jgi:PAS domain S-box-containing protein
MSQSSQPSQPAAPFNDLVRDIGHLAELSGDIFAVVDPSGRVVLANGRADLASGAIANRLRDQHLDDLLPAPLAREVHAALDEARRHGHGIRYGAELFERYWDTLLYAPASAPQPGMVLVWAHDITDEKRARDALASSQERLALALGVRGLAWWDWEVETGQVWGTDDKAGMLGYEPGEGTANVDWWIRQIHPDDYDRAIATMRGHLEGTLPEYLMEYRLRRKDGSWCWCYDRGHVTERGEDGRPLRVTGVVFDITELEEAREELARHRDRLQQLVDERTTSLERANEELRAEIAHREEAERRRQEMEARLAQTRKMESLAVLAGGIAHDFNNLMTAVLGNLELALEQVPPDSLLKQLLNDASASAARGADLSRQMLAYTGYGVFAREPTHLNELVRQYESLIRAAAGREASVALELGPDVEAFAGDGEKVLQAIINLTKNAAEALETHDAPVVIRTGGGEYDAGQLESPFAEEDPPPGAYMWFEVEDTGHGIRQEAFHKLFDPFFSTRFTGRGLGLSEVLGIVRGHRGVIQVYSTVGEGTRVRCLFPAA